MIDLAMASNRKLPYAKYLQIATIKTNGRPTARTVVFRCALKDACIRVVGE